VAERGGRAKALSRVSLSLRSLSVSLSIVSVHLVFYIAFRRHFTTSDDADDIHDHILYSTRSVILLSYLVVLLKYFDLQLSSCLCVFG
jgi:hypothetical protein